MTPTPSLPAAPVEAAQPSDEQIEQLAAKFTVGGESQGDFEYLDPVRFARALLAAFAPPTVVVEPAGFKLVPLEPTKAMERAGEIDASFDTNPASVYRAMVDAAPAVPLGVTKEPEQPVGREPSRPGDLVPLANGRSVDLGGKWRLTHQRKVQSGA